MKSMMPKLLKAFTLGAMSAVVVAPMALAVEFRVMTLQERADEVIVEVEDVIANFQALERSRLAGQADVEAADTTVQAAKNN